MIAPIQLATRIDEVAPDVLRISTAIPPGVIPTGFTFNQYLIRDLRVVGVGALLGRRTTPAKAAASRANGRKGGRPPLRA